MTTCHACQRPLDKTAEGYVYCGEWVYHMGCEPSSFPRLGGREVSEKISKYPIGSLVQHRASNERALVVGCDTWNDDSAYWRYHLEYGIGKSAECHGEDLDKKFVRVVQSNATWFPSSAPPSPPDSAPAAPPEAAPPQPV